MLNVLVDFHCFQQYQHFNQFRSLWSQLSRPAHLKYTVVSVLIDIIKSVVLVTSHKHDRQITHVIRPKTENLPLTFFSLLLVSWSLWKKEQKTGIWGEKMMIKERRVCLSGSCVGSERAGKWEYNPDCCQPFTQPHATQRLSKKNKHISGRKKSLQATKDACSYKIR